jgi:FAD/FMN-containing dehydrogenase
MSTADALITELCAAVGADGVSSDPARLELVSQDIWSAGAVTSELAVAPRDTAALAAAVATLNRHQQPIAIRGGGMSYTGGYTPQKAHTVTLDLGRMNRVLDINPDNMTVTVEAGCTWKALHDVLSPLGLRTPYWGTFSGSVATIGGSISQLSVLFGAGSHGLSSESVVALCVVLADGSVLRTGARGQGGQQPFFRHFGPDLTGLFCGDCGALGIKSELTLRLMRTLPHEGYLSFSFDGHAAALNAMTEIARAGTAAELFATDPELMRTQLKRASLGKDLQALADVAGHSGSLFKGVREAVRVALAGRDFAVEGSYAVHVVCEGRSAAGMQADLDATRSLALAAGGVEVENTVPKIARARPFPPISNILGPGGERWLPIHGLVALGDAVGAFEAIQTLFAAEASECARLGITCGYLFTTISTNALAIEPVLYWPEAAAAIHAATMEPSVLNRLPRHAANPAATAFVGRIRQQLIELFHAWGAAHLQVGRSYWYRQSRDTASRALLDVLKGALDPHGQLNPGVLGFPDRSQQ